MPNTFQIKRSLLSAAPSTLAEGEIAYVFGSDTLYIGAPGNTIRIIAGYSAFEALINKAINFTTVNDTKYPTVKAVVDYVGAQLTTFGAGDMMKSTYDANNDGVIDNSAALGGSAANLYALKTYVDTAISNLLNGAGAAYDTLKELGDLIASDQSGLSALTAVVGGKLQKDQNLSDLTNAGTARTNLGLGTMAVQNANAVAITGGSIDNVTFDAGLF